MMNDEYAVEPTACAEGWEVRWLLKHFGPQDGRYVAEFPHKWKRNFFQHIEEWPDIQKQRAKEALRQARHAFIASGRDFVHGHSWITNVQTMQASERPFGGVVVSRQTRSEFDAYQTIETFDPAPSDAYLGPVSASRLRNLARPLIRISAEIAMVDPYFQIFSTDHTNVLEALLMECADSNCQTVVIWTKAEYADCREVNGAFRATKERAGFRGTVVVHPVKDARGRTQFHDRYLLSIWGGLELSKGFQSSGRQHVSVKVIRGLLTDLVAIFIERKHDLEMQPSFEI